MPHTTRPRNQELTAINIDVNRNRIIRVNLYLTMASVAIASSTCVAGFFGMNLQIPETLANHPDAFAFVTGTSCLLAGITYGASLSYAQGFRRREGHNRLQDAAALQEFGSRSAGGRVAQLCASTGGRGTNCPRTRDPCR